MLLFILFAGLTMSLGWGIRGVFGHSLGAAIAGSMVGLSLCLLWRRDELRYGLVTAASAIGIGFGGQETYGNTVGFVSHAPWNLVAGYIGLGVKGFAWGLIGGAWFGVALHSERYSIAAIAKACALMIAGTVAGWALINRPRLVYFSLDREEVWAGLLVGGVLLMAWTAWHGRTSAPITFGLLYAAGGGIGFPLGAAFKLLGTASGVRFDWWKVMECTLGALLGAGIAIAAWRGRNSLGTAPDAPPRFTRTTSFVLGLCLSACTIALYYAGMQSDLQMPFTFLGSALLLVAFWSEQMAWHIGFTLVYAATASSLVRSIGGGWPWILVALTTVPWAWWAAWCARNEFHSVRTAFLALIWGMTTLTHIKTASTGGRQAMLVGVLFQIMVVVLTAIALRLRPVQHPGEQTHRPRAAAGSLR